MVNLDIMNRTSDETARDISSSIEEAKEHARNYNKEQHFTDVINLQELTNEQLLAMMMDVYQELSKRLNKPVDFFDFVKQYGDGEIITSNTRYPL